MTKKEPEVYEKAIVVYVYDKELTLEDINKVLKDMLISLKKV